ncbi:hypothetical protein AVEN_91357-1 [Araneus ventricosus]|uniref:Tc1-like transposase DDE domain-containing protein n=1 Tax=Araneus ventricosus TaxID=182803 RepID=A0A4Y2ULZ3_ARAVE|nr:hypothetical protein AVEN_91357-1 [Araneus ventricosus]
MLCGIQNNVATSCRYRKISDTNRARNPLQPKKCLTSPLRWQEIYTFGCHYLEFSDKSPYSMENHDRHIYRVIILQQQVSSARGAVGAYLDFVDDNACPHRATIVDEYLHEEDIIRLEWTAFFSDLNPVEHVWDILGRRVVAHYPPARASTITNSRVEGPIVRIAGLFGTQLPRLCTDSLAAHGKLTL